MNDIHRLAQLIAACWRVSGESSRIPTSHGLLDRALKATTETGDFPGMGAGKLHFVDSRIGLQCVEIPDVLEWAQRSQLTSARTHLMRRPRCKSAIELRSISWGSLGSGKRTQSLGVPHCERKCRRPRNNSQVLVILLLKSTNTRRFPLRRGMTK